MLKKISAISLVSLMTFSSVGFAVTGGVTPHQLDAQKPTLSKTNLVATDKLNVDPAKEVRVIVELAGSAAVETATKKGVKYDKLSKAERKQLETAAKNKQKAAKDQIQGKNISIKYEQEFNAIVNGFSAKLKYGDIEKIKEVQGVKNVYLATEYTLPTEKPDMKYSKELVEAQAAWNRYGYKGQGMTVGIIDSGVDPDHKDFVLTDPSKAELSEDEVESAISEFDLPGTYRTEKVPYGWNYMDDNDDIIDDNVDTGMHGMHVAGTVGANGDEEDGGIQGVAPEAQILALRVFGEEEATTFGDIYIKAIDDAIKLGSDVLNMSLGSPAGFVDPESPEQQAVKRAVDNGVVMSISAGNSTYYGNGYFHPYVSNPDYGVVGAPGVSVDSISVASYENTTLTVDAANVSIANGDAEQVMFLSAGQNAPTVDSSFELVLAGFGGPNDFNGLDLEGKFALVQRGNGVSFVDKALNAQKAGAAGVIVYNNTDGTVNMATDEAITIPQLFMLKADGERFAAALEEGQPVTVSFGGDQTTIPNSESGKMSSFSSWGITPNLDFKPEITAPGGQIYSTANGNEYQVMSGTSMAAPHVSGGSALVLQRVDEEFGLDGAARAKLAKKFLLNTSKPVVFGGTPVSPRRQGAGLMQLHAALSTPVTVTDSKTGEAKVALKEVTGNVVTFTLTAENHSNEAVTYDVSASAQTDRPVNGGGVLVSAPNLVGAIDLGKVATVNGATTSTIEVPAKGTKTFDVTVDVSDWDADLKSIFTNGYWLEGFVTLSDPTDSNPDLVVPYVGFKGDWDSAPILDTPVWDPMSYWGATGVVTHVGGTSYNYIGVDQATGAINPELIAISPNGDGANDSATYILSLLRNAKKLNLNVLNTDGNVVKEIKTEVEVPKNYYDGGRQPYYHLDSDWTWDGTMNNGKRAPEGQYYLQVEATLDFEGAVAQKVTLPVKLDVTTPKLKTTLGADGQTITVDLSDKTSGVAYWYVKVDGQPVTEKPYVNGETSHRLTAPVSKGQTITVVAVDNAGNESFNIVKAGSDGNNGTTGNKKN